MYVQQGSGGLSLTMALYAFQIGFMWQHVLEKRGAKRNIRVAMTLIQTMLPRDVHLHEIGSRKVADLVANHVGTFHLVARTVVLRNAVL